MRMSEGVEWALHSCLMMAWQGAPISTAKIASAFGLPSSYLNKQLQALAKAGVVSSTSGPRGGFRLARAPENITLLDVVEAIEGSEDVFRCQEIRQQGVGASYPKAEFRERCVIAAAMRQAEVQWRRSLEVQTLADIQSTVDGKAPHAAPRMRDWLSTQAPHATG